MAPLISGFMQLLLHYIFLIFFWLVVGLNIPPTSKCLMAVGTLEKVPEKVIFSLMARPFTPS